MAQSFDFNTPQLTAILRESLVKIFGPVNEEILLAIERKICWHQIRAGVELFHQDDDGLSIYFILIGRVRVIMESENHEVIYSGDRLRGDIVGEISILTGEKRTATIVAARDSVLVSLSKEHYENIIQEYPFLATTIVKHAIRRLVQSQNPRKRPSKPSTICLIPISEGLDITSLADQLMTYLSQKHTTRIINKEVVDQVWNSQIAFGSKETAEIEDTPLFQSWFDEQEALHTILLFQTDGLQQAWTKKCLQLSDIVLLIADTTKSPCVDSFENELHESNKYQFTKYLVLLHPLDTVIPLNTTAWLEDRKINMHINIRVDHAKDIQRLARIVSGQANGLVLSGGGAKGFAHLGAYKALLEYGIPIDFVGGTSIGALMGAFISFGLTPERIIQIVRKGALQNPTSDYSFFPFLSIIHGNRMKKLIKNAIHQSVGFDITIEDAWFNFFAVSCNYTESKPIVHTHGRLFEALLASISIPGAFPPVLKGQDLLMDGGTYNNFPTDIMNNEMKITNIIGVELARDKIKKINLEKLPSGWELFLDKLRPKHNRKYDLPSLLSILLNASLFYTEYRKSELKKYTDIYLNPDVSGYNMMDWNSFDKIFEVGYQHTVAALDKMSQEELNHFRS